MKVLSFLIRAAGNIAASMLVAFVLLGFIHLTFGAPPLTLHSVYFGAGLLNVVFFIRNVMSGPRRRY